MDPLCRTDWPRELEVVIEVPRFGFVKRRDDGGVDFITPVPSPFNYGYVPGTRAGDGDREDAIVLGPRQARLARIRVPVVARVRFVDAGLEDPKWVCSPRGLSARDRRRVERFFRVYAPLKRVLNALRQRRGGTRYEGLDLAP